MGTEKEPKLVDCYIFDIGEGQLIYVPVDTIDDNDWHGVDESYTP